MTHLTFDELAIPLTFEEFSSDLIRRKRGTLRFAYSEMEKALVNNYVARNRLSLCAADVELRFANLYNSVTACFKSGVTERPINSRSICPDDVADRAQAYQAAYKSYVKAKKRSRGALSHLCDVREFVTPKRDNHGKIHSRI